MWRRSKTYRTAPVRAGLRAELNSTQAKITGFDLAAMQAAHVVLIGAGGIGSPVAAALIRKGLGTLSIVDDDIVELKNLTRQWFGRADIGKYKAHCLARNLAADGLFPTTLAAYPFRFQELLDRGHDFTERNHPVLCRGQQPDQARRVPVRHRSQPARHLRRRLSRRQRSLCDGTRAPQSLLGLCLPRLRQRRQLPLQPARHQRRAAGRCRPDRLHHRHAWSAIGRANGMCARRSSTAPCPIASREVAAPNRLPGVRIPLTRKLAMADAKKKSPVQFITQIESVRLTNFFIRMTWKATAGLIAITFRLLTSIILAIVRVVQRNRTNW